MTDNNTTNNVQWNAEASAWWVYVNGQPVRPATVAEVLMFVPEYQYGGFDEGEGDE